MSSLNPQELARYQVKIAIIGGQDPYKVPAQSMSKDFKILPSISYPDIVNYLIFNPSPFTKEDFKAYKGLDAYKQYTDGYVREIAGMVYGDHCLVKAKVLIKVYNILFYWELLHFKPI